MKQFKLQKLQDIESNAVYYRCVFYLGKDKKYPLENAEFYDCSFRTNVTFGIIKKCIFSNCGFSGQVIVDFSFTGMNKVELEHVKSLTNLTSLNLNYTK